MNLLQDQETPEASQADPAPAADPSAPAVETEAPAPEPANEAATPEAPARDTPAPELETPPAPISETPAENTPTAPTPITDSFPPPASPSEGAAETGSSVAEKVSDAASNAVDVPPQLIFVLGVILMGMFLWYFGTEVARRKRYIGTFLAVAVVAGSLWFYDTLKIKQGIEIQGGIAMTIRIKASEEREVTPEAQQQAIKVLQRRLNALGTEDITLVPQGKDRIFLQVPGVGEEKLEQMKETLKQVAKLDFSIVHEQSASLARQVAEGSQVIPGFKAIPNAPEKGQEDLPQEILGWELVKIPYDMSGKNVASAKYVYTDEGDSISVDFTGEGSKIMGALTLENTNRQLAIILSDMGDPEATEDTEKILSAPVIRQPFATGCLISGGGFDQESARALASALENPLENPIEIEYSNFITPSMGKETLRQGVLAGLSGLAITLLFILIYYRFAGILAMVGLAINMAIIFGALALFKFTLTLPGIAGIILTIGVAIDANVLIYERLREEMAGGKSLPTAIKAAYEKAFSAIIDANITTLFTAIILFIVATGTVKGFAVTLTIGILASLFSALIVTRVCFNWATETGFLTKLSFMNLIPSRTIDFLSRRKPCMIASLVVVVLSLIIIPLKDPRGVDLAGGDYVTIRSAEGLSVPKIEESLADADIGKTPIVQSQTPVGADGEFFTVRSDFETGEKIIQELEKDFGVELNDTTTDSVGSAVGKEMLNNSALALGLGLFIILIYVTIRFEFAFALGAIVALFHDLIITIGVTTLLGREISLITIGAFLTIAGYSINDTIVVFDRVREGLRIKRGNVKDVMNYCLNATLGRTLLTSATTLITVLVLFLFGGPALRNFSLTLIVGVLIGTYSSIFIASPIVLWWAKKTKTNLRREILDADQGKVGGPGDAASTAQA